MKKPRIQPGWENYTAADAQRVLEELRSGRRGSGVVRFRRYGGTFMLVDEQPISAASNASDEDEDSG